jgi:hypothetical protein
MPRIEQFRDVTEMLRKLMFAWTRIFRVAIFEIFYQKNKIPGSLKNNGFQFITARGRYFVLLSLMTEKIQDGSNALVEMLQDKRETLRHIPNESRILNTNVTAYRTKLPSN